MNNYRRYVFLFCVTIWSSVGLSHSGTPVVLIEKSTYEGDSLFADSLYTLAKKYFRINMDTSLLLAEASAKLSERINYINGKYTAYRGITAVAVRAGDLEKSLHYVQKGLDLIDEANMPEVNKLDFIFNKGSAYIYTNDLGNAINANIEALSIAEKNGLKDKIGSIYNNMGILYRKMEKYEDALNIYLEGVKIRTELNDSLGLANTYFNLGAVYAKLDSTQASFDIIQKAKSVYKDLNMTKGIYECDVALGAAAFDLGLLEESYTLLSPIEKSQDNPLDLLDNYRVHIYLGEMSALREDFKESERLLNDIQDIESSDFLEEKITYYRVRSLLEEKKRNYKKALHYKNLYQEGLATYNNKATREFREEMNAKYESLEKDFEIKTMAGEQELISAKLKVAQQRNIGFGIGIALLIGFLSILYKLYKKIRDKNIIITQANKDKETLLKEIHHRVKNNLQVITSLLSMQERKVMDIDTKDALKSSKTRVQSMSILHQILYQGNNLKHVKADRYMSNLIDNILDTYVVDTKINVSLDVDNLDLDVDSLIPIGLISNELICNSIKHAFVGREQGNLFVSLKESNEDITLKVKDDGIGLPGEALPHKPGSLGKRLINSFVDQLNGETKVVVENGTSISVSFNKADLFKVNTYND